MTDLTLGQKWRLEDHTAFREAFRKKLGEITEFSYSDGCVLFWGSTCAPEEAAKLDNHGMLDAIARVMADVAVEVKQEIMFKD